MRQKRTLSVRHLATAALITCALTILNTGCAVGADTRNDTSHSDATYAAYGAAWMQIYDAQMLDRRQPARALHLWQGAITLLEEAHANVPHEMYINHTLAACYVRVGRSDDAARLLVGMLDNADHEDIVFDILRLVPDTDRVIAAFDGALANHDLQEEQRFRLLVNAGKYAATNGHPRNALDYYDAALSIDDSDLSLLFAAASACGGANEHDRGIDLCLRFLNEDRDLTTIDAETFMGHLAVFYHATERYADGLKFFEAAQERAPDSEVICQLSLSFLDKSGRVGDAIAHGEAFVQSHDGAVDVRIALATLYAQTDSPKTPDALREILTLRPNYWRVRLALAEYLSQADERDEAVAVLRNGLEESNRGFGAKQIRLTLADYLEQSGAHQEAISELERILEDHPSDPQTCNHLGYIQAEHGINLDEAARLIKVALASDSENTAYLDSLAWVFYKMALRDDSIARLRAADVLQRKAMSTGPMDPIITDHLGDICFVQGLLSEAAENWSQALTIIEDGVKPPVDVDIELIQNKLDNVKMLIEQTEAGTRPPGRPLMPPPMHDN